MNDVLNANADLLLIFHRRSAIPVKLEIETVMLGAPSLLVPPPLIYWKLVSLA